jgi:hypothetical protein
MFSITAATQFERYNERAAALAMLAGVIHGIAMTQYVPTWWGYGFFFIVAGLAQVAYGIALFMKPWRYDDTGGIRESGTGNARVFYIAGLIPTVAFVLLYLVTHTIGIPFVGPLAGQVEPATPLGVLAQLIHIVLAFHLAVLARYCGDPANQTRPT